MRPALMLRSLVSVALVASSALGQFGHPRFPNESVFTPTSPQCVLAVDMNLDGHKDLVTISPTAGPVSVRLHVFDGDYAAPVSSAAGSFSLHAVSGDFNGDGKPDLAVVNRDSNTLSI